MPRWCLSLALALVTQRAAAEDMSKFFATFKDCGTCVESGYGWCPVRRKCGGFANKECGLGEAYVAEGAPRKAAPQRARKPSSGGTRQPAGNDMSAIFAKFRDCSSCVSAGYGWCTIQRKCGGFANKECGIGPRYVSAEPAPRNGLWEPKHKRKAAEEAATADVPAAPPSPPASLLYAGPASPPPAANVASVSVETMGATVSVGSEGNGTGGVRAGADELRSLSHESLVQRVLELQAAVAASGASSSP